MGTQLWTSSIWLLLLIGVITQQSVAGVCKQECSPTATSVFNYQNGHQYIYNLEGTTITSLPGAEQDVSKIQLKATVELNVQSACNHLVSLKGVQVIGPDAKKFGSLQELEAHPVLANFQGGIINSQLCTEDGDSQAALNIKRAVLSLLQVAAPAGSGSTTITEIDVFGSCPTQISSSESGNNIHVKKVRDLNKCSHREDLKQDVLSTPFVGHAELQSTPLLDASLEVDQEIKDGVIKSAISHETYLFRPFSNQGSGAKTTVETKLTLQSDNPQAVTVPASINTVRSIIFEAPHGAGGPTNSNKQVILTALHTAGDSMKVEVGPTSARKFSALVGVLRQSSKEDLLSVYGQVKAGAGFTNKQAARNLFMQALFKCGTGDSVQVAVELLKNNEISENHAKKWYIGFAFVRHATLSSLAAVSSLLDKPKLPQEALLGIGSLAGRYCREHSCENAVEFNGLINKLSQRLKTKISTRQEETEVIAVLKALHNIHHLNDPISKILEQLASDKTLTARVRVAALETYHSDACRDNLKKSALAILNDQEEDSELRIKAYLVLVECPCGTVANNLKQLLQNEKINQVGSFIVSHLRNLRSSTNPSKGEAKHHLGLVRAQKHFPEDFRKFSHNYELSHIIDSINVGTAAESNVIFSQSSFVPRSVSVNTTVDIFGHSYNVFEINARVENLDRILESYLGPKGYLKSHDLPDIISGVKDSLQKYGKKIRERYDQTVLRNKRSVNQEDLDRIRNEVIKSFTPGHDDELLLDLSLKLFGSELAWISSDNKPRDLSPEGIINKIFDLIDKGIKEAKHFNYDLKQHWTFLDTELTYPTGMGLPLKLVTSGSSAAHLKFDGQIDIPALLHNPGSSAVQLEIIPSAAVEIIGQISVDAVAVESGLKVAYTLHTATGANVAIKGLDNLGIDVTLGLPLKNQDILNIKTEVLTTVHERGHSEVDTPVQFNINRKTFDGCFDQLSPIIGLTLCGELSFPFENPIRSTALFPLNGPSKVSLRIQSDDVTSYHFKALVEKNVPEHRSIEILFETPNSKIDRKLSLHIDAKCEPNHHELKVSLNSPWKSLALQGVIIETKTEHSITAKFINDDKEYSVKGGVKISGDSNHQIYAPLLEYKSPDHQGSFTKGGGKKDSYRIEGTVTVDKSGNSRKYTFNKVTLHTPTVRYEIDGNIQKQDNSFSSEVIISYGLQNIVLKSNLQKLGEIHYKVSSTIIPSQYKDFGIALNWEYERKKDELKNDISIVHGRDETSAESKISLHQLFKYKIVSPKDFDISFKNSLTYPLLDVNLKVDGSATPKSLNYDLDFHYDAYKIASELDAKVEVQKHGDYNIKFLAQVLNNTLKVFSSREVISPDQSKFIIVLELIPIAKYELSSDVTHIYQSGKTLNFQTNSVLKIDGQPKDYKLNLGILVNSKILDTQAKLEVGSEVFVDAKLTTSRDTTKPSGNLKLFLLEYIDVTSDFNFNKGGGNVALNIDIPKADRKIRGSGELTITGTVHVGKLDLHWNADKDPSQKLTIQTTTDLKPESIDSKNTIIVLDHKTILNVKGALTGKLTDGHLIGSADLTLPNGRQLTIKLDRTLHVRQINSEGSLEIVIRDTKKGSQARELTLQVGAKDVDQKEVSFDGKGSLEYKSPEGNDIKITGNAKNIPQGEKQLIGGELSISGSYVKQTIVLKTEAEVSKSVISYKANGGLGSDSTFSVVGKVKTGFGGTPVREVDNTIELSSSSEWLKHVKLTTHGSLSSQPDSPCELKINNILTWNNEKTLKVEGELTHDKISGAAKVILTLPNLEPRTIATTWSIGDNASGIKRGGSVTLQWGGNKEAKASGEIEIPNDKQSYKLKAALSTPTEQLHNIEFSISSKRLDTPAKHVGTDIIININEKKITVASKIGLALGVPLIDIVIVQPEGTSKLYINIDKLTAQQVKGQFSAQWILNGGGTLDSDGELKLSVDDFKLLWNVDSPKLKIDKWHMEAAHRAAKGAKKIVFSIKMASKTLASGSTTLRSKVDGNSVTYDGSGSVDIGDQKERFTFKLQRNQLVKEENGETGLQYKVNAEVGPKKIEGETKLTDKEIRLFNKYCLKDSDCAVLEATSRVKVADLNEVSHEAALIIDLKTFKIPHGIVLNVKNERKGWSTNQEVNLQLQSKDHQTSYVYKFVLSKTNSALIIKLPQRVIALEVTTEINADSINGQQKIGFSLWWDKERKPSLVSSGSVTVDHKSDENGLQVSGEAKFNNPSLEQQLVISGQGLIGGPDKLIDAQIDIDVFKNKNQKITVLLQLSKKDIGQGYNVTNVVGIKSKGLNLDISAVQHGAVSLNEVSYGYLISYKTGKQPKKEIALLFETTLEKLNILVKLPTTTIISVDGTLTEAKNLPVLDAEISIIGLQTIVIHSTVVKKGLLSFSSYIHRKDNPNKKIQINGDVEDGIHLSAALKTGSSEKDLFHLSISTKDNEFLKTDFGWSTENIKSLLEEVKHDVKEVLKKVKVVVSEFLEQLKEEILSLLEFIRKSQPNFKRLLEVYQNQLKAIKTELENDLVLKDISKNIQDLLGAVTSSVGAAVNIIAETFDSIVTIIVEFQTRVIESLKKISPKITEAYTKILNSLLAIIENTFEEFSELVSKAVDILIVHEAEIKRLLGVIRDLIHDVSQVFSGSLQKIIHELTDFAKVLIDEIKTLPVYSTIKERYIEILEDLKGIEVPEFVWGIIRDILGPIKDSLPTSELQDLITAIENYIQKKLQNEKLDDKAALEAIYKKFVVAVKSVISLIRSHLTEPKPDAGLLGYKVPFSINSVLQLPRLIAVRLSPLTFLTSDDLPNLIDLYYTYRPTLNPLDWIPPFRASGILISSHHFFTFDQRHYTFTGACQYILAEDYEDGNFSLVVNLEGGKVHSITLKDSHDTIELLADKSLQVNGGASEYPVKQGDLVAWKRYNSVNIRSQSGVYVHCHLDSDICVFHVSGFYFGRTRGLLGTINNEPWDDFTLPNGHVSNEVNQFGDAWRLNHQCAETSTVSKPVEEAAECTALFSGNTPLRAGFLLVKPQPYRELCNEIVSNLPAKLHQQGACGAAIAYIERIQREVHLNIPAQCVHCTIGGKTVDFGSSSTIKVPQRSADIVIVVERLKDNEVIFKELISPLVSTLTNDLKSKGISDVKLALIGYGAPEQNWPYHYTSNGGKFGFGGAKNIQFQQAEIPIDKESISSVPEALNWFIQKGTSYLQLVEAFGEANKYPFRADAVKTIIGVISSACDSNPLLESLRLAVIQKLYRDAGVTLNIVTPVQEITPADKPIVGFDSEHVYVQSDAKKKVLDGDSELRKNLQYKSNVCIESAQRTFGNVFNSNNFISAKPQGRKQFTQVMSHRIADTLTSHELVQECTCSSLQHGLHPESTCRVTNRREQQSRKVTKG